MQNNTEGKDNEISESLPDLWRQIDGKTKPVKTDLYTKEQWPAKKIQYM